MIVALSPLLMGSVHLPIVLSFLFVLFLLLVHQFTFKTLKPSHLGSLALFIAALAFVQLLPMPLSFSIDDLSLFHLAEGNQLGSWRPLSLEPYLTADRGIRFLSIGLLAFVVASIQSRNFYQRATFWLLIGGWVTLVFGLFLWTSQVTDFFGFEQSVRFRGPSSFVNTNHGASYFALLTLASWIHYDTSEIRYFSMISGLAFFIAFLLHGSMGVNLVFSLVLCVYLLLKFEPSRRRILVSLIVISFLVSLIILLFSLDVIPRDSVQTLLNQSSTRWKVTKAGVLLAADYPILGAGLGSTDTSILAHIDWGKMAPASIPTLENEFLEFFGTGGIIAGLLILGFHLYLLVDALKKINSIKPKRRHRYHLLLWLLFLGIVSLHFPWFTIGLAFPFVLLIQSTSTWKKNQEGEKKDTFRSQPLFLFGVTLLFVFLSSNLFFWYQREDIMARPLSSKAWINLATKEIKEKHFENALAYAEKAGTVDPRPKARHYLARVVAKNNDFERATELYIQSFNGAVNNRLITDMLSDLGQPELRNRVLAKQPAAIWRRAAKITQVYFSVDEAIDLAFDAIKTGTHEDEAKNFVSALFINLDQLELAKIWSQTQNLNKGILATIYLKEGDFDSFFKAVDASSKFGHRPDAYLLKHHEKIITKGGKRGVNLIESLTQNYCKKPLENERRGRCWRVEARLKVEKGDFKGARTLYLRIYHRSGNPMSLARFYLGQKSCSSIQSLINGEGKEKYKKSLSKLLRRCSTLTK